MLTEFQIETIVAETCGTYRTGDSYTFEDVWNCIEKALAAHSAEVQEPVAEVINYRDVDGDLRSGIRFLGEALEDGTSLYAHPQPMPQTDAAREVALRLHVRRLLDFINNEGPAAKEWQAISETTERIGVLLAEIERLDRTKGE